MLHHGLNRFIKPLVSLRLAIVCLALAMILVFVGTLGQVDLGTYDAQKKYFQSWFLYWTPGGSGFHIPVFPGGFLIGTVLLANLIATHLERFKFAWKKSGILLTHFGLILLLLGGLFTALFAKESHMRLEEGIGRNYSESSTDYELAIVDVSAPDHDAVLAIPGSFLEKKNRIGHPGLPFAVQVVKLFPNARLAKRDDKTPPSPATQGVGTRIAVSEAPETHKMDERNLPAALVELPPPENRSAPGSSPLRSARSRSFPRAAGITRSSFATRATTNRIAWSCRSSRTRNTRAPMCRKTSRATSGSPTGSAARTATCSST